MKFRKIVGFGDSWMWGDELLDSDLLNEHSDAHPCWVQNTAYRERHCFLGLLAQHYGVPCENFGIPGGSLQSEIWTLLWWLEHEPNPGECLVLVGHTDADRMSWYNHDHVSYSNDPPWNKFVHTAWTEATDDVVSPEWKALSKHFIGMVSGPEFNYLNWLQTVTMFDGVASRYQIPMLQFQVAPIQNRKSFSTLIWPEQDLVTYFFRRPENMHGRRALWCQNGHPNEKGHELIRDMLISEIDRVILSK